jgi:hypothetical protein
VDTASFRIIPEGGHQDPGAWYDAYQKLNAYRAPARCLYAWELKAIIRKHCHPRFDACGIISTVRGNAPRKLAGIEPHGTVWFSRLNERVWTYAIPCGCIPYSTLRTAVWNEEKGRWEGGELARGWRSLLYLLVHKAYLIPSEELSYLIGEDTFRIFPERYRR